MPEQRSDSDTEASPDSPTWRPLLALLWPVVVLVGLVVAGLLLPLGEVARRLLDWADTAGWWGPLFLTAGYTLGCLLVLPVSIFTFGAGFLYGVPAGLAVAVGGSTIGAFAGYAVSRLLLAQKVLQFTKRSRLLDIVRRAVRAHGRRVLLLTRMSPITPFAVLNYLYGALRVPAWRFVWTTAAGMLPGTFLCVYIGSGLRSLSAVRNGEPPPDASSWPYWAGLVGTMVAVPLIGYFARRALYDAAGSQAHDQEGSDQQTAQEAGSTA